MATTLNEFRQRQKPDVAPSAYEKTEASLSNLRLAEIRERMKKTQTEIAEALGVRQPTVAGMEKPGHDLKLTSLKRYVEAAGGKLRVEVELPDGTHLDFPV